MAWIDHRKHHRKAITFDDVLHVLSKSPVLTGLLDEKDSSHGGRPSSSMLAGIKDKTLYDGMLSQSEILEKEKTDLAMDTEDPSEST